MEYSEYEGGIVHNQYLFLSELNSILSPFVIVKEMPQDLKLSSSLTFQANLKNIWASSTHWNSNERFENLVKQLVKEYFGIDKVTLNNTGCIFWFSCKK